MEMEGVTWRYHSAHRCLHDNQGAKTLKLGVEKASNTAMCVAEFLEEHHRVRGLSSCLPRSPYKKLADKLFVRIFMGESFKVKNAGRKDIEEILSRMRIITPSPRLGGIESLIAFLQAPYMYLMKLEAS